MAVADGASAERKDRLSRTIDAMRVPGAILRSALARLMSDDGWALASHLALTIILALFPFLIFVTSLASFFNLGISAEDVHAIIFEGWPDAVAGPISKEVSTVLTVERHDLLTFGVLLTVWFSSNGVEALRVALERAYGVQGRRAWWKSRLLSIAFALLGGVGLLALSFFVVLGPIAWNIATREVPDLIPYTEASHFIRYGVAATFLSLGLVAAHLWLPVGHRRLKEVMPGIIITLVLWLLGAALFGYYISMFSTYASTYAGLAGVMAALVFLDVNALCFILGAEINAAIAARGIRKAAQRRAAEAAAREAASSGPAPHAEEGSAAAG
jgi:membrane protein